MGAGGTKQGGSSVMVEDEKSQWLVIWKWKKSLRALRNIFCARVDIGGKQPFDGRKATIVVVQVGETGLKEEDFT